MGTEINVPSELREDVFIGWRILCHKGLIDYLGHVSARVPGSNLVVMTPMLPPDRDLTADDLLVLDLQGNRIQGDLRPRSEKILHTGIYRHRPDVGAVVHAHPPAATALSIAGQTVEIVWNQAILFGGPVPRFEGVQLVYTDEEADELAEALGAGRAVLMPGHGATTVGASVAEACIGMIYLEKTASLQLSSAHLGPPALIDEKYFPRGIDNLLRVEIPLAWEHYRKIVTGITGK